MLAINKCKRPPNPNTQQPPMERMSSSLQSWVEDHKLSTIGGVWATAVGAASVAYSRRRSPARGTGMRLIHARVHAQALTLAVLGGAALAHHYYGESSGSEKRRQEDLDYGFHSQLPPATDADDGNENERWSW